MESEGPEVHVQIWRGRSRSTDQTEGIACSTYFALAGPTSFTNI